MLYAPKHCASNYIDLTVFFAVTHLALMGLDITTDV
jgi:hypothetical protein